MTPQDKARFLAVRERAKYVESKLTYSQMPGDAEPRLVKQDIPWLLALVQRQEERIEELREMLPTCHHCGEPIDRRKGWVADLNGRYHRECKERRP